MLEDLGTGRSLTCTASLFEKRRAEKNETLAATLLGSPPIAFDWIQRSLRNNTACREKGEHACWVCREKTEAPASACDNFGKQSASYFFLAKLPSL